MTTQNPPSPRSSASPSVALDVPKTTPERKAAIVALVAARGLSARSAALACSVQPGVFYRWVDDDEAFRDDLEIARGKFTAALVGSILKDAKALRSIRGKIALLERAPATRDEYMLRRSLDLSIEEKPIESEIEERYSQEQIDERLRLLAEEALRRVEARS
jgi:transposase-like protein